MIEFLLSKRNVELIFILAGRFAVAIVSLLTIHYMTHYLNYKEYSVWALLASLQNFSALFLINPLDQYLYRHTHKWLDEGLLAMYFYKFKKYLIYISLFFTLIIFIYFEINKKDLNLSLTDISFRALLIGVWIYFSALVLTLLTLLNLCGDRIKGSLYLILSSFAGLGISIILVKICPQGIYWIAGQTLGAIIGALIASNRFQNIFCKSKFKLIESDKFQFISRNSLFNFCLPLSFATGFMWVQNSGYRFFIKFGWGEEKLALFVLGLVLANQLTAMIESLAVQFLYPYFTRQISNASSESEMSVVLSDLFITLAPIYCIWTGFAVIFAPFFLKFIADVKYHDAVFFVIIGLGIEFFRCMTNLWSNTSRAIQDNKYLIIPYGAGAILLSAVFFVFQMFKVKFVYIPSALVISFMATYFLMALTMQKLIKIKYITASLYISFFFMLNCFVLALYLNFTFPNISLNYLEFFSALAAFFLMIFTLLYRNLSLQRLLNVDLFKRQ